MIADAGATAAETGITVTLAQALADALGVEVTAMTAAINVAVNLAARWVVMFGSQIASGVANNTITRGDANRIDADLGAAAVSASVLTFVRWRRAGSPACLRSGCPSRRRGSSRGSSST